MRNKKSVGDDADSLDEAVAGLTLNDKGHDAADGLTLNDKVHDAADGQALNDKVDIKVPTVYLTYA